MSLNNRIYKNNIEWNGKTTHARMDTAAAGPNPIQVTIQGSYMILSNNSGITIFIGSDATVNGVVIEPGGTFEIAVSNNAAIHIRSAAVVANGISLLWFE